MSKKEEQAEAYLQEAVLTLESAETLFEAASENTNIWAQVVKNAYDAIEQMISSAIADKGESIPRAHPAKIKKFIELYNPEESIQNSLFKWLRRRSETQYVDFKGDEINVPHKQFSQNDAEEILNDAKRILKYIKD